MISIHSKNNPVPPKPAPRRDMLQRTTNARSKLYELIVQFRHDAAASDDPKAHALFEFSAEMLAGMARSFRNLEEEPLDLDGF